MNHQTHMLRGDWLIEAIAAIHRNETQWRNLPTTPTPTNPRTPGRYHHETQTWWTHQKETTNLQPQYTIVHSPPEHAINYPGEQWTLTPTWYKQTLQNLKDHNLHDTLIQHINQDTRPIIAYYDNNKKRVVWGTQNHKLRHTAIHLSKTNI